MASPYPVTDDEEERVAALHALHLLDTPFEERFDRIARIAQRVFDVPTVMINLVDRDRQWAKSTLGTELHELPREHSFCTFTIHQSKPLVVTDARADTRFMYNPLVTTDEDPIRFYAGQPLHAPDGHPVGALCIIDAMPREVDAEELQLLSDLAQMVENELHLFRLSEIQKQLIMELDAAERRALIDPLTHLWNRAAIFDILQREWERGQQEGYSIGVILVDVDHFKMINDTYGHPTGDTVLRTLSQQIRKAVRAADAVGRYGGEEFMIVLAHCNRASTQRIANKVCHHIADLPVQAGERLQLSVTISGGAVSTDQQPDATPAELISAADMALYHAKRNGRNQIHLW